MTNSAKRCLICGKEEEPQNPLTSDGFYENVVFHIYCMNTEAFREWERQQQADAVYKRYCDLITIGRPFACPACAFDMNVSAKARGMGAGSWEMCCTNCHRLNGIGLSGYSVKTRDGYDAVSELEQIFVRGATFEEVAPGVERLAAIYDPLIGGRKRCRCGGRFSLAAKPRCAQCQTVLFDSYFHWAWPIGKVRKKKAVIPDTQVGTFALEL